MARVFTSEIPDSQCIGDSLLTINDNYNRLDTSVQSLSTLKEAITTDTNNLIVANNLTVTNSITALNDISIPVGPNIVKLGDNKIKHSNWVFTDSLGHITPINKTRAFYFCTNANATNGSAGSDQTFTVPSGVNFIFAKLWGAGGAGRARGRATRPGAAPGAEGGPMTTASSS